MEATAAAQVPDGGVPDFDLGGEVRKIEEALERIAEYRNDVSRAATGAVGSQAGHTLSARARHLSAAITAIEDGTFRLQAVLRGDEPLLAPPPALGAAVAVEGGVAQTAGITAASGMVAATGDQPFGVPVSTDLNQFDRQFLTVRPSTPIAELTRAAIERLGLHNESGTWCLHLEGRPLTDAMTAADAGLKAGSELVLLRV